MKRGSVSPSLTVVKTRESRLLDSANLQQHRRADD
jgi:hypothetical protein